MIRLPIQWAIPRLGGGLLAVGVALSGASAHAYGNQDYCNESAAAERVACHAQYLDNRSLCLDDRAFSRWVGDSASETDFFTCITDARATRTECLDETLTPDECADW